MSPAELFFNGLGDMLTTEQRKKIRDHFDAYNGDYYMGVLTEAVGMTLRFALGNIQQRSASVGATSPGRLVCMLKPYGLPPSAIFVGKPVILYDECGGQVVVEVSKI